MTRAALFGLTSSIIDKFGLDILHLEPHDPDDLEDVVYLERLAADPAAEGRALVIEAFADGKVQARYEIHDRDIAPATQWSSDIAEPDVVITQVEDRIGAALEAAGRAMRREARKQSDDVSHAASGTD